MNLALLAGLPRSALAEQIGAMERLIAGERLYDYAPYKKQKAFHAAGLTFAIRLFLAGNQLGKAQPLNAPVLTPSGWRAIGSLAVGDEVIAGDGTVTRVRGVYPQGERDLYRLTFDQGEQAVCCAEHLWQVTLPAHRFEARYSHGKVEPNPAFGRQTIVTTADLVARYKRSGRPKSRVVMPHVGAVQFAPRGVPVDPYLLGVLLGDGCLRNGGVGLSSADAEIIESIRAVLPIGMGLRQTSEYDWRLVGTERRAANGQIAPSNDLKAALVNVGVYGKLAHEKYVPTVYLLNAADVRLAVLQGLLDTDGSIDSNGMVEFCSTSRRLADDVLFLARSFGGKGRIVARVTTFTDTTGARKKGRESYRVHLRLPQVTPFRLSRKVARIRRPVSTCDAHVLHSIEPAGRGEAVCIAVDHPSQLYVTSDFIVTHNTVAGGAEWAMHLTGRYPAWWKGQTFDRAPLLWAGGVTGESTRDNPQRILVGPPPQEENWGTGMIPRDALVDWDRAMGVPNLLDNVVVRHGGGGDVQAGQSICAFKAYEKGREKWQGPTVDGLWWDEEPPLEIYTEGLTRTNNGQRGQFGILTLTPLMGMTEVLELLLMEKPAGTHVTTMEIEDAEHYTPEQRKAIIASYPAHEREARTKGIPTLGSGRIFPVEEDAIKVQAFPIPAHWPRIAGMDFGSDHPTACAWHAWDRDTDTVYVYHTHRLRGALVPVHAAAIKAQGAWIPVAWPHDGLNETAVGPALAKQYKAQGVNMRPENAKFPEDRVSSQGSRISVEAGVSEMLTRMETGKWKVFAHLNDWFEEFRLYHRKDGKIVKLRDDLLSGSRYALMDLRYAKVPSPSRPQNIIQTVVHDREMGY